MDTEFLWGLIKIFRNASGRGRRGEGRVWGLTCKEDEGTLWSGSNVQYVGGVLDYTDDTCNEKPLEGLKDQTYTDLKFVYVIIYKLLLQITKFYGNIEFSSWYLCWSIYWDAH